MGTALVFVLAGCGDDGSSTPITPAATTPLQVNMGDAPADWLLSFSMNVSSMSLTTSSGETVSVASSATPVEMIHRLGTMEAIAQIAAPRGTYTSASLNIASCTFAYKDPNTHALMYKTINGPINASVPLGSNISVGDTPLALNFDLDLQHSLTSDGSGAFQFAPQFHIATGAPSGGNGNSGNSVNARHGGMYQMMGVVTGVSSDSFSMKTSQATNNFTFRIATQTQFHGRVANMAGLATGMGVLVTATLQSDGSYQAQHVRATMNSGGAMGGGVIINVDAVPATALTLVMQNGAGASVNTDYLSKTLLVHLTDSTKYEIDSDRVSLTGLPFQPVFDASNVYAGQTVVPYTDGVVAVISSCDPACGEMTASTVRLHERGIRGTTDVAINPGVVTSFTLTLPTDCAFTALTGATQILVYQQAATNVEDSTAIAAGTMVRVHGLLFNNAGQWTMVASTISSAP
ncbi:MAG: DUF5666 domain-containing protein [Terracidiphilus sp.]